MITREFLEQREKKVLEPYAMLSALTLGRKIKEEEAGIRTVYQRDKDRIIHSSAFRRLEYKTQVFVNHEGDYYRTRLTHTIEVSQIAGTIARALGLNDDLSEAIALAHDIGHTPFGHAGEEILDEIMKSCGDKAGFEHNAQGLRVVDCLEERYGLFDGLNLTYEVREGILKHKTCFDNPLINLKEFATYKSPTLEAQVVNVSDEIAYDNHDLDDGLKSGLIVVEDLIANVDLWKGAYKKVESQYSNIDKERKKLMAIRQLINLQVIDLVETSMKNLKEKNILSLKDVREKGGGTVSFSLEIQEKRRELKKFLFNNMYKHYRVQRMCLKAKRFIRELFFEYVKNSCQLPPKKQQHIDKWGIERVVCDYISEMTDRYALDEYKKLFDPYEKV